MTPAGTTLRIVSWNMNSWQRSKDQRSEAWRYLVEELEPDIALVQEARPPDDTPRCIYAEFPSTHRPWGTAVVVCNPDLHVEALERVAVSPYLEPGQIEDSHPGASVAARITGPGLADPLICVSFYGVIEKAENGTGYATTAVGRMLSDLTPLLDAGRLRAPWYSGETSTARPKSKAPTERHMRRSSPDSPPSGSTTASPTRRHKVLCQTASARNVAVASTSERCDGETIRSRAHGTTTTSIHTTSTALDRRLQSMTTSMLGR